MDSQSAGEIIAGWPEEAREAAELVLKQYGEPHETSASSLTWYDVGHWKRVVAQRTFWEHRFPAPHTDSVETFIDYRVPLQMLTPIAEFDGSVMVERTSGEVSARCHDEQANNLALNLMHDLVTGRKSVAEARDYYAAEFTNARRKRPTPYMDELQFSPTDESAAAPDERVLSDDHLAEAEADGQDGSPGERGPRR